jgi:hypothetical protein
MTLFKPLSHSPHPKEDILTCVSSSNESLLARHTRFKIRSLTWVFSLNQLQRAQAVAAKLLFETAAKLVSSTHWG